VTVGRDWSGSQEGFPAALRALAGGGRSGRLGRCDHNAGSGRWWWPSSCCVAARAEPAGSSGAVADRGSGYRVAHLRRGGRGLIGIALACRECAGWPVVVHRRPPVGLRTLRPPTRSGPRHPGAWSAPPHRNDCGGQVRVHRGLEADPRGPRVFPVRRRFPPRRWQRTAHGRYWFYPRLLPPRVCRAQRASDGFLLGLFHPGRPLGSCASLAVRLVRPDLGHFQLPRQQL
jgi:hypothetical protein